MAEKKRFVFAEKKRALEMAATCGLSVISENQQLRGYQLYMVEQWVCDRKSVSNVIKLFTGDQNHIIQVAVIAISAAELQHPRPEIQRFLNAGAHFKSKPTPLGEIVLTNTGVMPIDMDMILVDDGDYDKWVNQAYVNINLRRTNCTGRSSLNLQTPNSASEEKFRSLYKIADAVDFQKAVINLVSLVQIALYLFKLLDRDYIDGLLCDATTNALWTFYTRYNPIKTTEFTLKEAWMEPHLVAAIISKLLVCRNKLQDNNFTALKDPFADYDTFRFDIGDYQRYKNIRVTKFIDLETLAKLNEHTFTQLKVAKVLKSKLDDISGITNSPLFSETSDPEVFRHHSTIESLRAIWRPKLKGGMLAHGEQQPNELLHMLKRTTRTGGVAADMLSRVAGSIPWINTTADTSRRDNNNRSPPTTASTPSFPNKNIASSPFPSLQSKVENTPNLSHVSSTSSGNSSGQQQDEEHNAVSRMTTPAQKSSPLSNQISTSSTPAVAYTNTPLHLNASYSTPNTATANIAFNTASTATTLSANAVDIPNRNLMRAISSDHLDQDIPSYVQSVPQASTSTAAIASSSSTSPPPHVPKLRISNSTDTTSTSTPRSTTPSSSTSIKQQTKEEGDFVPYIVPSNPIRLSTGRHHSRSISDSILIDSIFIDALKSENSRLPSIITAHAPKKQPLNVHHRRSQTILAMPSTSFKENAVASSSSSSSSSSAAILNQHETNFRPVASMNVQTYMTYNRLRQKQQALKRTYEEIRIMANMYEKTAAHLKETYEHRSQEFDVIQHESRLVLEEQSATEKRLKDVEDNSAKLHYELKVLNDKLRDIEDNVGTFYGKVGLLERKMDDSQQSITTMLIVGNYFNHYWKKLRERLGWLPDAPDQDQTTKSDEQVSPTSPF
ncbi:hypothetical protein [Parasitella parasitica]|uniref:STB6-like N-terminal domain-containing protein n=1 Tax=Parasitella parasitica TaxID=35722 RepID=A0A0B7NR88_9FUNG|nr:hypothetical protein [Parasitella parasitica]